MYNIKPPKGETIWEVYFKNNEEKYMVTSKTTEKDSIERNYFLYEIDNGKLIKRNKSKNPLDFRKEIKL